MSKRKNDMFNGTPSKRDRPDETSDSEGDVNGVDRSHPGPSEKIRAEVGVVESITLRNFMCHSFLGPCNFGPNVNFVIGNNGSGKSAILTALIVALGGTAQSTSRGTSLKGFVKEGESSAEVSVTLRNRGSDAYRIDTYGRTITVNLRITKEGMRTYKLRNRAGKVVSTKKEELMTIMDHLNIQVQNPLNVLTQEMSKTFLHSKGEGDKYKFFMKATQLEQMKENYLHIKHMKELTEVDMSRHKEALDELKNDSEQKEERYKNLSSLDELQEKLEGLRKQMAWALVEEMEKELERLRERVKADERATIKYDRKVDEWKGKMSEGEKSFQEIQKKLEAISQRLREFHPQMTEQKNEVQRCDSAFKKAELKFISCRNSLRDLERDKAQLTARITELRLSISQTSGAASQARAEQIQQLQAELEVLGNQDATLEQQISQYQQAANRAKDELGRLRQELAGLQRPMETKRRDLQNMERSRSNRLQRFGEHMPALLSKIDTAYSKGQFRQKPRGPLGYCISLKDPSLALAVEVCLKSCLSAFTCDNYHDEKVLQGLMRDLFPPNRRPIIITSSFLPHVHDTRRRAVNHPQYPTVLQALEIEDPVVTNCLIDQRNIESILLIKDTTEARRVMMGPNPPRHCLQAFSKDGDQIYTNRCYSSEQSRANYLSGDVEEEIRHLRAELENQMHMVTRFQQQMKKVEEDVKQNQILFKKTVAEQKKVQEKARGLQLELTDLQNIEEPQSEDLKPLEEELEENAEKISCKEVLLETLKAEMAALKASHEEAKQKYSELKEQISTVTEEADPIKEELSRCDQELTRSKHNQKHYEDKREAHLDEIAQRKAQVQAKEQELEASVAKATEISPERVEVSRPAKILDQEISRMKIKIDTQQEQQGDRGEIIKEYKEALERYRHLARQVQNLTKFISQLELVMENRHKAYSEFRRFLSVRCKYYFDSMLFNRGYTGIMDFDHKNETLSLGVQRGEDQCTEQNDTRCLSGGERSFSTVCFVLSLWQISESPFRCLDEFDVFMDMVNRRISMDMMLKIAYIQQYRQFIFLTPQSMSSLPVRSWVRILRLEDPERGQKALPAAQRDEEAEN